MQPNLAYRMSMRSMPVKPIAFSIIVPTFNRQGLVVEALESISQQTYPHWECIVVDDGSTDDSESILRCIANRDQRFRYLRQCNSGAAAARNSGVRNCAHNWIVFLDSDDLLLPDALSAYARAAQYAVNLHPSPRILSGKL